MLSSYSDESVETSESDSLELPMMTCLKPSTIVPMGIKALRITAAAGPPKPFVRSLIGVNLGTFSSYL
jgi:hypothetical protein